VQWNFDGMQKKVEGWRESQLAELTAKLYDEFQLRTPWSLSKAFYAGVPQSWNRSRSFAPLPSSPALWSPLAQYEPECEAEPRALQCELW
jgi:hypothetical protein